MASKLLNVRMDQEMIEDLKKVCGELEISVTDAIKLFSNKLIEERTLNFTNENRPAKEIIEDMNGEKTYEEYLNEYEEVNRDPEKFEKTFEDITDIALSYFHIFKKILSKDPYDCCKNPYEYFVNKFTKEYGEELKNKIIEKLSDFCKLDYDEWRDSYYDIWIEGKNFQEGKHLDVMENLKKDNPNLYQELLKKYCFNITIGLMYSLGCKTYEETKNRLENILTTEEINLYLEYKNCPSEKLEEFKEKLSKDEVKYQSLKNAFGKLMAFDEEISNKRKEEDLKRIKEEKGYEEDTEIKIVYKDFDFNAKLKDLREERKKAKENSEINSVKNKEKKE